MYLVTKVQSTWVSPIYDYGNFLWDYEHTRSRALCREGQQKLVNDTWVKDMLWYNTENDNSI